VAQLEQLRPLCDGVNHLVLNGDTLDTRPGPSPDHTAECRDRVRAFFPGVVPRATFLTGNHDADFSPDHHIDLADGAVYVVHGDIFFDDIVPWSADAPLISRRIAEEMARLSPSLHHDLEQRLALFRRVAASIPQRHQSEKQSLKYTLRYLADTVWPPLRVLRVLRAWKHAPLLGAALARQHRPKAKFVLAGHTHRPGIWPHRSYATVVNTGSFCPPLGGLCVDVTPGRLTVRRVTTRRGEFFPGETVGTFPLAAG
jgi:UDP-2,3-diacylglucosamine pyrophosphatase LpxH